MVKEIWVVIQERDYSPSDHDWWGGGPVEWWGPPGDKCSSWREEGGWLQATITPEQWETRPPGVKIHWCDED